MHAGENTYSIRGFNQGRKTLILNKLLEAMEFIENKCVILMDKTYEKEDFVLTFLSWYKVRFTITVQLAGFT